MMAMLWMSCGDHTYKAHCDLADGFLVHMHGRKRVRVWPVPVRYRDTVIFNYRDFDGRLSGEFIDFELEPGQILFIPAGAMHEVIACSGEPCVSVSFHMGSPHALLTLCAQLNMLVPGGGDIALPRGMRSTNKFEIFFFEPTRFIANPEKPSQEMPGELRQALLAQLRSKTLDEASLGGLLDSWWQIAQGDSVYLGPYPPAAAAQPY
jgi:hypothetical protein